MLFRKPLFWLALTLTLTLVLSACGGANSGNQAQEKGIWDNSNWDAATWQ